MWKNELFIKHTLTYIRMHPSLVRFKERFGNPSSIESPGKHFTRWKEVTLDSVKARLQKLDPRLTDLNAVIRPAATVINVNYHYNCAIDYRVFFGNTPEAQRMREVQNLAGLASVLRQQLKPSRLDRQYSTALLYGQVINGPTNTCSPYEQVDDLASVGGRVAPSVSRSRLSTLAETLTVTTFGALSMLLVGLPSDARITLPIGFGLAIFAVKGVPKITNNLLMSTWRLHSRQMFEAIERFGIDGFIVAAMEPWRVFTIMRRLDKLERKGILDHDGLTEQGKSWYLEQMAETLEVIVAANRHLPPS
jgi:hypothetical protein